MSDLNTRRLKRLRGALPDKSEGSEHTQHTPAKHAVVSEYLVENSETVLSLAELMSPTHKSAEPPPFIQPDHAPNSEPRTYEIGSEQDDYGRFEGLPQYRWPRPGTVATEKELDKAAEYSTIRTNVQIYLNRYLELVAARTGRTNWLNSDENSPNTQELLRHWSWVKGVWQGLGVQSPSEEKLNQMANSWLDRFLEIEAARTSTRSDNWSGVNLEL